MRIYSSDFVTYLRVLFEYKIKGKDTSVPETIAQCVAHINKDEIDALDLDKESINKVIDRSLLLLRSNQELNVDELLSHLTQNGCKLTPAQKEVYLKSYQRWCADCHASHGDTGADKAKKLADIINRTQLQPDTPLAVQLKQFWENINLVNNSSNNGAENPNSEKIGLVMVYPEDVKIKVNATAWQHSRIYFHFNPSQEPWENHAGTFAHEYTHILTRNIFNKVVSFMTLSEEEKQNTSDNIFRFFNSLPHIRFEFPRFIEEIFAYCSGAIVQDEYFKSRGWPFVPQKHIIAEDRFVGTQTTLAARAIYPLYEEYVGQGKQVDEAFWRRAKDIMNKNSNVQKLKGLANRINRLTSDEFIAWNGVCLSLLDPRKQIVNPDFEAEFWRAVTASLPKSKTQSRTVLPDNSR